MHSLSRAVCVTYYVSGRCGNSGHAATFGLRRDAMHDAVSVRQAFLARSRRWSRDVRDSVYRREGHALKWKGLFLSFCLIGAEKFFLGRGDMVSCAEHFE